MKKLLILFLAIPLFLVSCVSEPGPPGPPGQDGLDGINILGQIFEVTVDFNSNDNFSVVVDIPSEIEVFDTDIVMTYVLTDVIDGVDVWEPLPQTLFFGDEILLYGYNYTFFDVELFLDGTVDLNSLPSEFTQDIVFRVAVIPADMAQSMDLNSLGNMIGALKNNEIIKLN